MSLVIKVMNDYGDLHDLALAQGGVFITSQATRCGADRNALSREVARGHILHLGRSVYALGDAVDTTRSAGERAAQRHALLSRGLLLLYPDALLAGRSAVLAHELPAFGARLRKVRLERPLRHQVDTQSATIRPFSGVAVPTASGPATPVAQSVVQLAVDDGMVPGVVAADAAIHTGATDLESLASVVEDIRGLTGSSRAVAMLTHVDGRSESVGESRLRVLCASWGIGVVPQVDLHDRSGSFVARVDLMVEGTKVVLEFDGAVKYAEGGLAALVDEKRREDRIRALGYTVIRVTWADLEAPGRLLTRIRAVVAAAS